MVLKPLRVLVGIANFGTRNRVHLDRLLAEYRAMPWEIDVHLFSEKVKDYPADVTVHVGLPTPDPWSLPFAHRPLFAQRAAQHDLFVYSEDDTLIESRHLLAFLAASAALPEDHVAAFVRYEERADGARSYPDMHGPYRWAAETVRRSGDYVHARLSNDHAACYVLTQAQLQRAIASGGYLVAPHGGRYDLLCSAGTDPYTQCGLTRVVCVSHLGDFEVHHLPDAYVRRSGMIDQDCAVVDDDAFRRQVAALSGVEAGHLPARQLFATEKRLPTQRWDKRYHEAIDPVLLSLVPVAAAQVLSVGCGSGVMERRLVDGGSRVVAVPLDSVIASVAARADLTLTAPDLHVALAGLAGTAFDAVLLHDVLQHLEDPAEVLRRLSALLGPAGVIVGSVPNLGPLRRWAARLAGRHPRSFRVQGGWARTGLHVTSARWLRRTLAQAGLRLHRARRADAGRAFAPVLYFVASRSAE
jgi:2-polyprenyl-3-methyl-5-hydroxy-6-metoxy-1,4-benzoquinol methylase